MQWCICYFWALDTVAAKNNGLRSKKEGILRGAALPENGALGSNQEKLLKIVLIYAFSYFVYVCVYVCMCVVYVHVCVLLWVCVFLCDWCHATVVCHFFDVND